MVSKAAMTDLVRAHRADQVAAALRDEPRLLEHRDKRGRNWLHMCCMASPEADRVQDSIRTADVLLAHYEIDDPAFVEGEWQATPLWHAIAWGRNVPLVEFLLSRGASPNHCLFAAAYNNDLESVRLLIGSGADLEQVTEGETPLLGAVKYSRFDAAELMLEAGADPDFRNSTGMTALHYMLKKDSGKAPIAVFARFGARGDISDATGRTAVNILRRKKDPEYRALAERLARR